MSRKLYLGRTTLTILDNKWTVFFCDGKQYKKAGGPETSRACTLTGPKRLLFNCEAVSTNDQVAVHELVHAYASELMGHDLSMNANEREEFFCVLFETRGKDLLRKAAPITRQLMKHAKQLRKYRKEKNDDPE